MIIENIDSAQIVILLLEYDTNSHCGLLIGSNRGLLTRSNRELLTSRNLTGF